MVTHLYCRHAWINPTTTGPGHAKEFSPSLAHCTVGLGTDRERAQCGCAAAKPSHLRAGNPCGWLPPTQSRHYCSRDRPSNLFRIKTLERFCGPLAIRLLGVFKQNRLHEGPFTTPSTCRNPDDPDLKNYAAYPVSKKSFRRKVWRDLSGQTGWRRLRSIGRSIVRYNTLNTEGQRVVRGGLITNIAFLGLLTALGQPWLYLVWVGAFVSTHMLSTRLRQIGEHAAVPNGQSLDPRDHTRTILTKWWERLLIAPHQIGYHLEHHLLPSVPIYRLPTLHKMLVDNGYLGSDLVITGYPSLIRRVTH